MIFIMIYEFLADHVPALGAFLVTLLVVVFLCFIFYKIGRHEANRKWSHDVECMPKIIEQEIREKFEKRIVALGVRNKYLQERNDSMMPAFKSLAVIAEEMLQDRR